MTDHRKSKQSDTKVRILDVAEQLFAENGFKRTSINLLAKKAGVNQAAVNYHFGSKDGLVEQVIVRRISPIENLRMKRLGRIRERVLESGQTPDIIEVLRAFIEPTFALTESTQCFLRIAGRAFSETDSAIRKIFIRHFKSSFLLFFELTRKVFPDIPREALLWRLQFVIGAASHCMRLQGDELAQDTDIFPSMDSADTVVDLLVPFLASGMHTPLPSKKSNT